MINRVQAFNNKNNHNQNFGMAFKCENGRARMLFNAMTKDFPPSERLKVNDAAYKIATRRADDRCADIVISSASLNNADLTIGLYNLKKQNNVVSAAVPGTLTRISAGTSSDEIVKTLEKVDNEAECQESLGGFDDILAGIDDI